MSNKTLVKWLVILAVVALAGWLVSWYLACGVFIGAVFVIYAINHQYSLLEEVEAEVAWQRNWHEGKAEEFEEDGIMVGRWTGFWRPLLFFVVLAVVIALVAHGIFVSL